MRTISSPPVPTLLQLHVVHQGQENTTTSVWPVRRKTMWPRHPLRDGWENKGLRPLESQACSQTILWLYLTVLTRSSHYYKNAFNTRMQDCRLAQHAAYLFKAPILFILLTYGSNISQNISWEMPFLHLLGAVASVFQNNILCLWIHNYQSPVPHIFIRMQRLQGEDSF